MKNAATVFFSLLLAQPALAEGEASQSTGGAAPLVIQPGVAEQVVYQKHTVIDFGDRTVAAHAYAPRAVIIGAEAVEANGLTRSLVGKDYECTALGKALSRYERLGDLGSSSFYAPALYLRGWCLLVAGDWSASVDSYAKAADLSRRPIKGMSEKSGRHLREVALGGALLAASAAGNAKDAMAKLAAVTPEAELTERLEALQALYLGWDAHQEVAATYKALLERSTDPSRRITYQTQILETVVWIGEPGDVETEAQRLVEIVGAARRRPGHDPVSEQAAENTLREFALESHKRAKDTRGAARASGFDTARNLYQRYLELYPEQTPGGSKKIAPFVNFYLAEALYERERFAEAAAAYERTILLLPSPATDEEKSIVNAALTDSVRALKEAVEEVRRESPPAITGTKPTAIPPLEQKLLAAAKRYVDRIGPADEVAMTLRYEIANIYYTYNHFDQAAPALDRIVEEHPRHELACFAALLTLDILNLRREFRALRTRSSEYRRQHRLACAVDGYAQLERVEEQAAFSLIGELEKKKRYAQAAAAYLDYYMEYKNRPGSTQLLEAINNAAQNYERAGLRSKARETRQFLVLAFDPEHPVVEAAAATLEADGGAR